MASPQHRQQATSHARKCILVEVILDTSDPWSYVGVQRLHEAARRYADRFDVQVRALPCVLDPRCLSRPFAGCAACQRSRNASRLNWYAVLIVWG